MADDFAYDDGEAGGELVPLSEDEAAELESLKRDMADTQGRRAEHWEDSYWHSPRKQARARELLEREAAGAHSPAPAAPDAPAGRVSVSSPAGRAPAPTAAMEGVSGGREITAAQINARGIADAVRAAGDDAWAREIEGPGGAEALAHGENMRRTILAGMGDAAADIARDFDALDDNVRLAVHRELGRAYLPRQRDAEADQVRQFSQTMHGRQCCARWGQDAPGRLAIVLARWDRMTADLSDAEFDALDRFFRYTLAPEERVAIFDLLSS